MERRHLPDFEDFGREISKIWPKKQLQVAARSPANVENTGLSIIMRGLFPIENSL
jgi:hypothetical protein